MGMRSILAAVLVSVLAVPVSRSLSQVQIRPARFIAHRYDDSRVIFSVGKTLPGEPALRRRSLAQNPSRMPDPVAKLAGMTVWQMEDEFWKRHAKDVPEPVPGEEWTLRVGGTTTLHCRIERLAVAEVACGAPIVAIGVVDPSEQAAFKQLDEKHYLIFAGVSVARTPSPGSGPAALKEVPVLDAEAKAKLEAALQDRLTRELPRIRRSAAADYALMSRMGMKQSWQDRDDRLAQGEGKLSYDLQALKLTPDGGLR